METGIIKISEVKKNKDNPRRIKPHELMRLKKSLNEFPEMLEIRPIVIDENNVVLGGNMRLRAMTELNYEEVYYTRVTGLTEEQKKEFIIKDNNSYGDWDWDLLINDWDIKVLPDWGLDVPDWGKSGEVNMVNKGDEFDEWVGMPEFEKLEKRHQIIINFETEDDREVFLKEYPMEFTKASGRVWSTNYPYEGRNDLKAYKYE